MKISPEQLTKIKISALEMRNAAYHDGKAQITDMRNRNFQRALLEDAESTFFDALIDVGLPEEEEVTV